MFSKYKRLFQSAPFRQDQASLQKGPRSCFPGGAEPGPSPGRSGPQGAQGPRPPPAGRGSGPCSAPIQTHARLRFPSCPNASEGGLNATTRKGEMFSTASQKLINRNRASFGRKMAPSPEAAPHGIPLLSPAFCAVESARLAWPGRGAEALTCHRAAGSRAARSSPRMFPGPGAGPQCSPRGRPGSRAAQRPPLSLPRLHPRLCPRLGGSVSVPCLLSPHTHRRGPWRVPGGRGHLLPGRAG